MTAREIRQSSHMTETEALMWAAESDPWLSSGMGSVFVLDEAPDFDRFIESMERASHSLLRLRERVEDGLGISPPRWVIDDQFDIEQHVRRVTLPKPGGRRELLDLAAQVFQDPFDVHRPLWQFVAVEGPTGRKTKASVPGAIIMKLHHSVSDGIGALRLAEMYLDFERNPKASGAEELPPIPTSDSGPDNVVAGAVSELDYVLRQQLELARRAVAEVSLWGADRARIGDAIGQVKGLAKSVRSSRQSYEPGTGSPIWKSRSRHRHLETFDVAFDDIRAASKKLGGSINDVFVAGSVLAASRYHAERDVAVEAFNLSFVISTRQDDAAAGNSFAPVPFSITGEPLSPIDAFALVKEAIIDKRDEMADAPADMFDLVAGFATMMPDSAIAKAGRARAASQDWATSNLRGAPIPIFVAGGEVTHMYPVGPIAGTAFNLTAMSYTGNLHFGLHVDPHAVDDPEELRDYLVQAYKDLCN